MVLYCGFHMVLYCGFHIMVCNTIIWIPLERIGEQKRRFCEAVN